MGLPLHKRMHAIGLPRSFAQLIYFLAAPLAYSHLRKGVICVAAMSELDELIGFLSDRRPPVSGASPWVCPGARRRPARLRHWCHFERAMSFPLQIVQHAAELVQGLTGSPEGVARLAGVATALLPPLLRLVPGPSASSRAALVALVNMSQAGWENKT